MPWTTKKHKNKRIPAKLEEDFPESSQVASFLTLMNDLFPKVADLRGWARYRQGGHVRQWMVGGTHNYTDPNGFTQFGSAVWEGDGSTHAWMDIVLPTPHSGLPLAFATIMETIPISTSAWCMARPYHAILVHNRLALDWWSVSPITKITIAWLVYGPGSVGSLKSSG